MIIPCATLSISSLTMTIWMFFVAGLAAMRIAEKVIILANRSDRPSATWAKIPILPVSQLTAILSSINPTTTPINSSVAPVFVENTYI